METKSEFNQTTVPSKEIEKRKIWNEKKGKPPLHPLLLISHLSLFCFHKQKGYLILNFRIGLWLTFLTTSGINPAHSIFIYFNVNKQALRTLGFKPVMRPLRSYYDTFIAVYFSNIIDKRSIGARHVRVENHGFKGLVLEMSSVNGAYSH